MLSITRLLWVSGHINVSAPTLTPGSRFFHTLLLYLHVWQRATFREQRSADDRSHPSRPLGLSGAKHNALGHETGCYDDLTVRENLRFVARAAGSDAAASDAVLERVGLTAQGDVAHGRLSAGQRRRLALAVALARNPRLLLLDEPHAGLDAAGRAVLDAVVAAAPAEDRTVILASHELDRTRALAGREVVLAGGVAHFGVAEPPSSPAVDAATEEEEEVRAG